MEIQYLIRLDDACPTMDAKKWQRMEDILDKYGIKPMVGIIPYNEDPKTMRNEPDKKFWDKPAKWKEKGWVLALHGYNHVFSSDGGMKGLNPFWARSEFAGLSLKEQKNKIRDGVSILRQHDIDPKYFYAPGHTFDENTLKALEEESDIRIISDTIATKPYKRDNFIFIPQVGGHCTEMKLSGVWTFCFHPNTLPDNQFDALEFFLKKHKDEFISFDEIDLTSIGKKDKLSRLMSCFYFSIRKLKGIK